MSKDTQIVETVSGTWLRFPNNFKKFHCLVELPDQLSLNINTKSGCVHVHKKDCDDVFQYVGKLYITANGNQLQCTVQAAPAKEEVMETPAPGKQSDAS
ncbi:hypothetical protein YDYSG_61740 [Paenibacillus tyrfis]|uniref:hypothetical protein n=1 Tax=Paenibacillus tyrfis TaxID=1501230 RepID=UPI002491411C|nr:hypothetical protein [Paenibacillus tyrfis]GLI10141.1 hypothetical protein YDYSG_61740 [Paenibacillus tyrfis]